MMLISVTRNKWNVLMEIYDLIEVCDLTTVVVVTHDGDDGGGGGGGSDGDVDGDSDGDDDDGGNGGGGGAGGGGGGFARVFTVSVVCVTQLKVFSLSFCDSSVVAICLPREKRCRDTVR